MIRIRLVALLLIALLAASLGAPTLPKAEAADAQFVLAALAALQENYVDQVPAAQVLNAALDTISRQIGFVPAGNPIPASAGDDQAAALFVQRFDEALAQAGGRVSSTQLAYVATAGMLDSLHDSHTGFLPPDVYQEAKRRESGEAAFTGIGIALLTRDGQFYAWEVYPDSPAAAAGLQPFDRVLAVDGRSTSGLDLEGVSAMIRGEAGTSVVLTVGRSGVADPLDLTIVRRPIVIPGVASRMLEGRIGYIKVYEFVTGVGDAFREAVLARRRDGMSALVLDLRGNPGGLVDELRDVSSALLPQSTTFLQMVTRGIRPMAIATPNPPILPPTIPIIVLVDEDTGSAAELLAAALQEHARATIEGTKTAGAVEIGITVDLPEGAGMSITVARVLTANGARLEGRGVVPDVAQQLETASMDAGRDSQLDKALELLHRTLGAGARHLRPRGADAPPPIVGAAA